MNYYYLLRNNLKDSSSLVSVPGHSQISANYGSSPEAKDQISCFLCIILKVVINSDSFPEVAILLPKFYFPGFNNSNNVTYGVFFPPVISNQSTWVLYELMCWLSVVVRSPPARRSLSWIQSTVD